MTQPLERTMALVGAHELILQVLSDESTSPALKRLALWVLRHYPDPLEIQDEARRQDSAHNRRTVLFPGQWLAPKEEVTTSALASITLFLDFDGVLHRDGAMGGELFEPACILALAGVLSEFPIVEVVISSSWREVHPLQDLRDMVPQLEARIVAATPDKVERIHLPDELWSFARHGQCWAWQAWNRPSGTPWIALDDQAWRFAPGCPNLLVVDGKTGFTDAHAAELRLRIQTLLSQENAQPVQHADE